MASSPHHQSKPIDIRNASIQELQDGADRIDNFLATMESGHPERAAILNDKCMVYYVKWKKSGVPEDVVKAVQAGRTAVEALTPNDTSKGSVFGNLAASLKGQFRYSSKVEDLEDAINYGKLVLTCFARGSPQWKTANANLCDMMCEKGCFYRTKEALDEAFEFLEQAGAPGILPNHYESSRLSSLSAVLVSRFEATGSVQDLKQGIEAGYKSIETLEDGAIRDHEYLNTSAALITHFHATGHLNSLEEAIRLSELFLAQISDARYSDAMRAFSLCSHGSILELKSRRYQDPNPQLSIKTLREAMELGRKALSIVPPHAENLPMLLSTVSSWMGTMAKLEKEVNWTEQGIELLNRALELNKGYTINNSDLLASLSRLWEIQYGVLCGNMSDGKHINILQRAIDTGRKALLITENDSRIIGERRKNLASMLYTKYLVFQDSESLPEIKELFIQAAKTETTTLLVRIPSALQAGLIHWAYGELKEAHDVFQNAIGLLTESNIQAASAEDLQQTLREIPNLGSLAASASLAVGRPPVEAIRSLEAANCILAGLAMSSRSDVSELEGRYPEHAKTYIDLRTRLAHATRQLKNAANYQNDTTLQQSLIREMASMEDKIRHLDGFEQFQLPLGAIQMMQLATDGPIVTINVSELRSDAIIVTEEGIQSLHLPGLTRAALQTHASNFNSRGNPARRDIRRIPISPNVSAEAGLRWLWDVAVRPILDVTKLTSSGRLWWITSGLAGRMPFHAAGNYAGGPEDNAPSRITSSYISSLKALKYGRDKGAAAVFNQNMLLVTMSNNPPPHRHLNVAYEEEAIGAVFGADKLLHLAHPDPEIVLEKLPEFSFVHFACHGASINNDPNRSGLLLVKDGRPADLTIANLEEIELKEGSVAYLSACSTAEQTDSKLAGEAIHLANSFQALGFQHVIGTMWGADDAAAGEVAKRFYKKLVLHPGNSMGDGQRNVATALHEAVKEYRLASPGQSNVLKWGPFIHVGI